MRWRRTKALAARGADGPPTATTTRGEVVAWIGSEGGFDAQKIYKDEAPGVVTVVSQFGTEGGEGSGFVLNGDGEIVTNAHVVTTGEGAAIRRASEVYVEFADGNRVAAKVLGHDPNADIALLRVDPKGLALRPLPLGDSEKVTVGSSRSRRSGRRSGRRSRCRSGSSPRSTAPWPR